MLISRYKGAIASATKRKDAGSRVTHHGVVAVIDDLGMLPKVNLKLGECVGATCVDKTPKAVFGLQGSTSDIFVDNKAYSEYLAEKFKVSTVDQESAAIAMAAKAGGVPVNVVLGVSDLAGGDTEYSTSLPSLPATNALIVSVGLVDLIFPWLQSVV